MGAYFIAILFDINYLAWPDPVSVCLAVSEPISEKWKEQPLSENVQSIFRNVLKSGYLGQDNMRIY